MNAAPKFLFDECVTRKGMRQLESLVPAWPQFEHITDIYGQGTADAEWIPKYAAAGGWVVITGDRARQSGQRDKLPELCLEYRLTHILLSDYIHHRRTHEKIGFFAAVWDQLLATAAAKPGSRYLLRMRPVKKTKSLVLTLELKFEPPD